MLTAMADDPQLVSLLNGYGELLEAMRRLATLADMLLQRASTATPPLTSEEAAHVMRSTWCMMTTAMRLVLQVVAMRKAVRGIQTTQNYPRSLSP
jgi:hypothetical protein